MNKSNLYTSSFEDNSFKDNIIFIVKLILFATMVIGYCYHVMPQYEGQYTAGILDKLERLETIDAPKIVLLGNSNLAFGIDSEMIESELGMPVVNMGLHGGLGNAFHEEMAKYHVTEGDIYIICHSDFADKDSITDPVLAWTTIENHFRLWSLLRFSDIRPMLDAYPTYLKKSLSLYAGNSGNIDVGGVYARSAFNEYGDVYLEREGSVYTFKSPVNPPAINRITVNRINELNEWLENQGATLLIAGYPIGKGEVTAEKAEFVEFQNELEAQLNCAVISQYTDYMYDYSYFYDTNFHLNSEGVKLRTRQLIEDITNWRKSGI